MKRSPIRKVRSKPRPGRLKGAELTSLRMEVFERAGGTCDRCNKPVRWEGGGFQSGHMHHVNHRSLGGKDELNNLLLLCFWCHDKEHRPVKPCPAKPKAEAA